MTERCRVVPVPTTFCSLARVEAGGWGEGSKIKPTNQECEVQSVRDDCLPS